MPLNNEVRGILMQINTNVEDTAKASTGSVEINEVINNVWVFFCFKFNVNITLQSRYAANIQCAKGNLPVN